MDTIRLRSGATPVLFCSLGDQGSRTTDDQRCPKEIAINAVEHLAKAAITNDGQNLLSLQSFSLGANCAQQSRRQQ